MQSRFPSLTVPRTLCLLLVALGALHGANAQEALASVDKARLRVFGQNGVTIDFYENSQCVGGDGPKTRASGGMGDAFSSFIGRAKNSSIGMTATATTASLEQRDGYFSKAFFREYEVAANQPVSVDMYFKVAPGGAGCSQFGGTFTPETSKEYEITLNVQGNRCLAVVQEIRKDEQGQAGLTDVTLMPTFQCR